MSDWHNWKVAVDECHHKHIGPPPALQRRLAYLEAHSDALRAAPPFSRWTQFKLLLKSWMRRREM